MKSYELIIFDFDGTLVDTLDDIAYYANQVLGVFGFPQQPVLEVKKSIGSGVHDLLRTLAPSLSSDPSNLEKAVNLFKASYRAKPVIRTDVFQDVRAMLEGPLSNLKKAIVTNKPQDITEQILKELKIGHYFEMTIGIDAGFLPKPDAAATQHVISSLGFSPKQCVFVGDSSVDAFTAKNAGVDFAWVSYGYDNLREIKPLLIFSSPAEWRSLA